MKITLAGYIHIITTTLILVYSIAIRNPIILGLGLALILVAYYEYVSLRESYSHVWSLEIKRSIDRRVYVELEDMEIKLTIRNKDARKGFPRLIILDQPPRTIKPLGGKPVFTISLRPGATANIVYRAKILSPGRHTLSSVQVAVSDVLNYFYEVYGFQAYESVTALPLKVSLRESFKTVRRIIGVYVRGKSPSGLYDLASFREYVPGDDIRRIVWKEYAKTRKLIVRIDYGEARPKALLLIDVRPYMWRIGDQPNTLAHIHLRLSRALLEFLVRSGARVDAAICSGAVPKITTDITGEPDKALYDLLSILDVGGGCESPLTIYSKVLGYTGKTIDEYDLVVLVVSSITIYMEGPEALQRLVESYPGKLLLVIPHYNYYEIIGEDKYNMLMSRIIGVVEKGGLGVELVEESLMFRGEAI